MIQTGLEVFLKTAHKKYRGQRLGVLCNQASIDRNLRHISELVLEKKLGLNVTCFIGPQHGVRGEKQDNMIESEDFVDPVTRLPVFSLYGTTREPSVELLNKIDTFVVDLQDIGSRVYTFMYTLANCMRSAKEHGKKVVVLDRPNPVGGELLEGNTLEKEFASFVGQFPLCVRHGMTMGELARMFNKAFAINCDLEVVPVKGWKRGQYGDAWGRDWVPPSPNIPNLTSAIIFSGMVFFEGTNISEGRGTTKPFEFIGAPYIKPDALAEAMNRMKLPGVYFRPIFFQPTYQKHMGKICGGVQIHVTQRKTFNAFRSGLYLLDQIASTHPGDFEWKKPPYEYEYERMPIDLIAGTSKVREAIDQGEGVKAFDKECTQELKEFAKLRKQFLLYGK